MALPKVVVGTVPTVEILQVLVIAVFNVHSFSEVLPAASTPAGVALIQPAISTKESATRILFLLKLKILKYLRFIFPI